jgi:hypothetical protein
MRTFLVAKPALGADSCVICMDQDNETFAPPEGVPARIYAARSDHPPLWRVVLSSDPPVP